MKQILSIFITILLGHIICFSQELNNKEKQLYGPIIKALNSITRDSKDFKTFHENQSIISKSKIPSIKVVLKSMQLYKENKATEAYKIIYNYRLQNKNFSTFDSLIIYQQIGTFCLDIKDLANAEKYLTTSFKIIKRNKIKEPTVSSSIINLCQEKNDYKKAIKIIQWQLKNDVAKQMDAFLNLSYFYSSMNDIKNSEFYLKKALIILKNNYIPEDQMFIYLYKGNNALSERNKNLAISYYKKSLSDTAGMQNWYPYVMSNYQLTNTYLEIGKYDSCEYYLNRFFLCPCLDIETQAWLYGVKADFYKIINNKEKYISNLKKASELKDSLIENTRKSFEQTINLSNNHFDLIEDNLIANKKSNEANAQKKNLYFILFIISIFALFGISTFIRYRSNQKTKILVINEKLKQSEIEQLKLKEESLELKIKAKNMDINQMAKNITIKKEFDEQQKIMLKELMQKPTEEIKRELRKIYNQVNNYDQIEDHLEILQKDVENVNSEFFLKMKTKYPQLSQGEIEICSLHLLKLSTKEIAVIRNVNARTIQINRYRIKKKLGLDEETDLVQFLEENVL